ncbi:MAG: hypothetical protein KBC45_08800 [Pseudomonas sp.]|uniref:hypothetical protein n=1 Tax=Pseudomonas sp. TaxID=306 RepID=UPI001B799B5C|nr:hypothetical protein [Pseudomonas sp.]MBP6954507.1 hypothetical protein [Pseudomonas sp.]
MNIDWSEAPVGATHFAPSGKGLSARWFDMDKRRVFHKGEWEDIVYWAGREDLIQRPEPAAWTGEGLPPVGADVEFKGHDGVWRPGTYVGQFNGKMVVGCHQTGVVGFLSSEEFRPIRTPEQIAAEERLAAINYMEIDAGMCATAFDGDPEARVWVENLIDNGWRKQVPE